MARIPLQIAQPRLDRDPGVSYPQGGGPIGAALTEFGSTITEVAGAYQARKERQDIFDGNLREEEFQSVETLGQQDALANAPADGSDMVAGLYGEVDPKTGAVVKQGSFDKRFDEAAARMPEGKVREEFLKKRELYRLKGQQKMAPLQITRRRDYEAFETEKQLTKFENDVAQADPDDPKIIADFKARGEAMIRARDMDELDKDKLVEAWNKTAEIALGRAMITKDASRVRSLLGVPKPGEGGGGGAVSNTVAKIIGVESGGDPNAKNPRSSATGLGQFTAGTWMRMILAHRPDLMSGKSEAEVLALRKDPAISREMTTALTKESEAFLGKRGLPVTEGTLYLAHFLGAQGAANALQADPGASAASVLGDSVMNANPHLKGMTIGGVVDWASKKMGSATPATGGGGAGAIDPRFGNLTLEQRLALANAADSAVAEQMAALRADLDVITTNAPVAIQNTGVYTGAPMPGQEDFIKAYGADTGPDKYRTFQATVETAESVYAMQKMPEAEIQSMLKAAAPLATGDTAALGAAKYASLEAAAEATMKARAADPAGYVRKAFPNVEQDWQNLSRAPPNQRSEAYSRAVAASIAAQKQLGIAEEDVQPLPKNIADNAVKVFKDVNVPEEDRIQAAAVAVASTPDPKQQQAIFEQLVDAGMPEITQGAFRALSRGDPGAARRLFQASIVDPTKLPGKVAETPAVIEQSIQDALMQEGQVGDIYYGLSDGVAENFVKAERDAKLMTNAVNMRLRQGEELESAVAAVAKDLYGNVQIVTGDGRANMQILMPAGENPEPIIEGLEAQMPAVRKAVEASLAAGLMEVEAGIGAPTTGSGMKAVGDAATQNHADYVMAEGHWRNAEVEGGFVFIEPYDGEAIADAKGEPIIFKPAKVPPRPKGPVTDSGFEERTPAAGAGPSVDEFGNPVVLPK